MSERSAAIGLARASDWAPPPNNSAAAFDTNDQVTASRSESEAKVRLARRARFCNSVNTGFGTPASSRGSGTVGARLTPAMRRICSTTSAFTATSGRHDGGVTLPSSTPKPRRTRIASPSSRGISMPISRLTSRIGEAIDAPRRGRVARDDEPRGLAAAEVEDEFGREFAAWDAEVGIDAALETVARIGDDPELAAGLGDIGGVPQRALDQDVARVLIAAGMLRRP